MKKLLLLVLLLPLAAAGQDKQMERSNPVIYADFIIGGAAGSSHRVLWGWALITNGAATSLPYAGRVLPNWI